MQKQPQDLISYMLDIARSQTGVRNQDAYLARKSVSMAISYSCACLSSLSQGVESLQSLQALPICNAAGASAASRAANKPRKLTQTPDNNVYSNYLVIVCHNIFFLI